MNIPPHPRSSHQLMERVVCFHFLALMNNASMNICTQVLVWTYVHIFLGYIPMSRIAVLYGN